MIDPKLQAFIETGFWFTTEQFIEELKSLRGDKAYNQNSLNQVIAYHERFLATYKDNNIQAAAAKLVFIQHYEVKFGTRQGQDSALEASLEEDSPRLTERYK